MTKIIPSIAPLLDKYKLFILDQWGVIHNGHWLLEGALEAMKAIKQEGGTIAILSNSGKRAISTITLLQKLGVNDDLYDFVLTSGEDVHRHLSSRDEAFYQSLGPRYFLYSWDNYRGLYEGLPLQEVDAITKADFIMCAGFERASIDDYMDDLALALAHKLPLIVTNPDLVSVDPDGTLKPCPGMIAQAYQDMGGKVRWHGKPDPKLIDTILTQFKQSKAGAIMIGDSLSHDILGANRAGIDSLLIGAGIHKGELSQKTVPLADIEANLSTLCKTHGAIPTWLSQDFKL